MRLTLRTMLAYIDDILEPADAEEIGRKVEQSETATNLLHRVRDVMRRLRLGAPGVNDRGDGLDPNTVAEYLDNTLPDAQVPDFERICLESDVHLAEVASCHQVLALVLGEPAEVDPASRQRMYQLPEVLAARDKPRVTPPKLPERVAADGEHRRQIAPPRIKPPVPEYLRETARKRRLWRMVAGMVVLVLVALVALAATGQLEPGSRLGTLLSFRDGSGTEEPGGVRSESPTGGDQANPLAPVDTEPAGQSGRERVGLDAPALEAPKDLPIAPLPTPGPEQNAGPTPAAGPPAAAPTGASGRGDAPAVGGRDDGKPVPGPAVEPAPKAVPAEHSGAKPEPADAGDSKPPMQTGDSEPAAKVAPPVVPEAPPAPAMAVAKYIPRGGCLLRSDGDPANWHRVRPNPPLTSRDKLLSLPAFRPMIVLIGEVPMEMVDGTRVDLHTPDNNGVATVSIDYGRVILRTEGKEKTRVRIRVGERTGMITFGDADSAVAIEVSRGRAPGIDPETQPLPRSAAVYATTGRILWQEGSDREPVAVSAPVRLTLNDKPLEAVAVQQFPAWVGPEAGSPLDQRAAATIERELEVRPVGQALRELAEHRQREVRWLAMRSLGYVGDFELIVRALNDPEQRQFWSDDYVKELREAVVRSPETAAAVHSAMQKLYAKEGTSLYEMLWKYADDRLTPEDAAQLIRYLDHETLAFRVLAFWGNLRRITGLGLYYRPEDTAAKRQPSIAKWKDRLKSNVPTGGAAVRERATVAEPPPRPSPPRKSESL